jgi:hypothetical protein
MPCPKTCRQHSSAFDVHSANVETKEQITNSGRLALLPLAKPGHTDVTQEIQALLNAEVQ